MSSRRVAGQRAAPDDASDETADNFADTALYCGSAAREAPCDTLAQVRFVEKGADASEDDARLCASRIVEDGW